MIIKVKNMKKLFRTGFITALAVILATGWCYGATILFPYINSNPGNLSTIVNVINTATLADLGCSATEDLQLHYRYFTKEVTASAIDVCEEIDFVRPTTRDDLVTFDAAGDINSGEAMFNDATDYNGGAGAPAFDLPNMGLTDARRGYLLVNHRCSVTGEIPARPAQTMLDGEVMLLDVVNGAAWGYQSVIANQRNPVIGNYGFASDASGVANPVTSATTELLSEVPAGADNPQVAIYPPDEFQTRFFVTPLIINSANVTAGMGSDMRAIPDKDQKRTQISLLNANANIGATTRDEVPASGGAPVHVRCVAGIDLDDLTGGGFGPWFHAQGGWVYVDLTDPLEISGGGAVDNTADHCAIVMKLQFGSPSFASGMINSCSIIRSDRIR
jgi:hypothetical protein